MPPEQAKKPSESEVYALVVGKIIATLRAQKEWSQEDLARRVGLTQSTLSRIERGQAHPDPFTFKKFAEVFGMGVEEFHARVNEAMEATKRATQGATKRTSDASPWWEVAIGIAGIVGLVGLVSFAVAAILEEQKPDEPEEPEASPPGSSSQSPDPRSPGGAGASEAGPSARQRSS
ncbi:helix-turn-helix domain-containing protein [Archangium primigenium]|uniref:helix-turn-helix domain-containing protein n=1 Tax=[Archangium] primigenium TaxID=2792470 RepID=UPI00195D956F|nr:helix-turn-helix transcriptional regulator [Archangium primigenium]MBM7112468.1 helix-turn-helix transcriptional regulator [Archangium primigenium]